jgi:hypothetical protein
MSSSIILFWLSSDIETSEEVDGVGEGARDMVDEGVVEKLNFKISLSAKVILKLDYSITLLPIDINIDL